jgi:hypothetical protein
MLLGDINAGIWPSRLGESQMRQWSKVTGSAWHGPLSYYTANCRPVLSSERAPHRNKSANFRQQHSDRKYIWSQVPQRCSKPRHTDWPTVSRKVTSTSAVKWLWLCNVTSASGQSQSNAWATLFKSRKTKLKKKKKPHTTFQKYDVSETLFSSLLNIKQRTSSRNPVIPSNSVKTI